MAGPMVSDQSLLIFLWNAALLCQMICVFGIATNIINIVCFIKQGFKDPVNVSLLGLAVSDLGSLVPLLWAGVCATPAFMLADVPFDIREYLYLTGSLPHTTFTRISAWITALITLERCLCIAAPLKVKQIVTSKRVAVILVSICTILVVSVAPVFAVYRVGQKFSPSRNKTIIGLHYTQDRESVEKASFFVNNALIPMIAFVVIVTCTIILVIQLRNKTQWRIKSSGSAQTDQMCGRDQKVAKMVVMISCLFIACYIPMSFLFVALSLVPGFSVFGKYKNILDLLGCLSFILEAINSSVNIFIYYDMSSKYRSMLVKLFMLKSKTHAGH